MNAYKRDNRIIAALVLVLGGALTYAAPQINDDYSRLIADWQTNPALKIRAFHWPAYIWVCSGAVIASIVYCLGRATSDRSLRLVNIWSFSLLGVLVIVAADWLTSFVFCHAWGCTPMADLRTFGATIGCIVLIASGVSWSQFSADVDRGPSVYRWAFYSAWVVSVAMSAAMVIAMALRQ